MQLASRREGSELQDVLDRLPWQKSEELASYLFLDAVNPVSVKHDLELYTVVVERGGRYAYLPGQVGTKNESTGFEAFIEKALNLKDTRVVATVHTHGRYEGPHSNQFSGPDVTLTRDFGIKGYLGTPSGRFLLLQPGQRFGIDLGALPPSKYYE